MHATAAVFAHQGGWDELLFVMTPVAVFGLLLWLANRRALAEHDDAPDAPPEGPEDG